MKYERIAKLASFIRDLGLIAGVPTLIYVGVNLHQKEVDVLQSQIEELRLSQYDRMGSLLEGMEITLRAESEVENKRLMSLIDIEKRSSAKISKQLDDINLYLEESLLMDQLLEFSENVSSAGKFESHKDSFDENTRLKYQLYLIRKLLSKKEQGVSLQRIVKYADLSRLICKVEIVDTSGSNYRKCIEEALDMSIVCESKISDHKKCMREVFRRKRNSIRGTN